MGCDIHMIAEIQKESSPSIYYHDGIQEEIKSELYWSKLGDVFLNQYYDPTDRPADSYFGTNPLCDEPWQERNYLLFSILANVRNYWDKLKPISEPKGIPEDASDDTKKWLEEADHSFSYLTLEELEKFKWDEPFKVEKKWFCLCEFNTVITQLRRICYGLKLKTNQIRIVFGFDN